MHYNYYDVRADPSRNQADLFYKFVPAVITHLTSRDCRHAV